MGLAGTFRVIGILLMLFSLSMLPPMLVSWLYADGQQNSFLWTFCIILTLGTLTWLLCSKHNKPLRKHDGCLITVFIYLVLGLSGALPFYLSGVAPTWSDAVFESFSGLTTTGATVLVGLDALPQSLLLYRQLLQWLGGMGIVILAVAILPILGIAGMQLYRAEIPTPDKDSKLTPRIAGTARVLWLIYLTLTLACLLGYWLAGMSWFDAVCHSLSTVALGGFSTHDLSFGWFDNQAVELIAIFFMLVCSINFSLHFVAWQRFSIRQYFQDAELNFFFLAFIIGFLATSFVVYTNLDMSLSETLRVVLFQTVSLTTTSGFTTTAFADWPSFAPILIFLLAFMGGCAGSTAGGMKPIRVLLIMRQGLREINRLVHPSAVYHVKVAGKVVEDGTIHAVWGFFSTFVFLFLVMMVLMMATGLDFISAFSAVGAAISNLGPGLGSVASNYSETAALGKWVLCLAMLLGRLEIYTLLVLLSPSIWR